IVAEAVSVEVASPDFLTNRCSVRRGGVTLRREGEGLMRAILRTGFGGPDVLVIRELPEPEPKLGHAVIQVKAFGLNNAELHMRKGEWAEIADISGIECVGVVKSCPGGEFAPGTKV